MSDGSEKLITQEEMDENTKELQERLKLLQDACDVLYAELADLEEKGLKDTAEYKEKEIDISVAEDNLSMLGGYIW